MKVSISFPEVSQGETFDQRIEVVSVWREVLLVTTVGAHWEGVTRVEETTQQIELTHAQFKDYVAMILAVQSRLQAENRDTSGA